MEEVQFQDQTRNVIDVDAVAIFSITATLTNLMKVSGRRDRSYILLPDQLTATQKNLPLTKKRTNQMLRGLHHNSRVRKTPQTTLIYYRRRSRHEPVTGLESREIQTRSQESNLITKGKIAGKPVHLMLDTGASVSAIKEEFLKEIYGDVPFFQTGKAYILRKVRFLVNSKSCTTLLMTPSLVAISSK